MATRVYLEQGQKRVFACAVDWPGWCRSGKTPEQALEAMLQSAGRYDAIVRRSGYPLPADGQSFEIIETLPGTATTDFGAPDARSTTDDEPLGLEEADRLASILEAAWQALDEAVAAAPTELRKGPRGGGRDRDQVLRHVLESERAYARSLGVKAKAETAAFRRELAAAIRSQAPDARWPVRYWVRRAAWHVIDHIWEIEDRSEPA